MGFSSVRLLAGLTLLASTPAFAHNEDAHFARLPEPSELGVVVDESYTVRWMDADEPVETGTPTVNLFYTADGPPTFLPGEMPPIGLMGAPIAEGIPEEDLDNEVVWDTTTVPSGHYWIWSRVDDPGAILPVDGVLLSPAPVTVRHAGDTIGPTVRITAPSAAYTTARGEYAIQYEAFAPNGEATVRLEAGRSFDGTDFVVIADDLPADTAGSFLFDAAALGLEPDSRYTTLTIRAVISDDVGTFTAYAPAFLIHDQGPPAKPAPDEEAEAGGCTCARPGSSMPSSAWLWLGLLIIGQRRGWSAEPSLQ